METPSVHDYHVVGYEVDGDAKRIVLHTAYRYPGIALKRTDVVFEGVEAYVFRYDSGCIVLDIEELPLEDTMREHWDEFEAGSRKAGWPEFWQDDPAKTRQKVSALARDGVRWFELTSSIGMQGWVMCRTVQYHVLES
jgi:hypothetical protein